MSNINMKVSPDLKRYTPGQKVQSQIKNVKKENEEKEEEDIKTKGGAESTLQLSSSSSKNSIQITNTITVINLKNITSIKENQTSNASFSNAAPSLSRINEKELDKLFDKLVLTVRERNISQSNSRNFNVNNNFFQNFDNVYKSKLQEVNLKSIKFLEIPQEEKYKEEEKCFGENNFNNIVNSNDCLNSVSKRIDTTIPHAPEDKPIIINPILNCNNNINYNIDKELEIKLLGKKRADALDKDCPCPVKEMCASGPSGNKNSFSDNLSACNMTSINGNPKNIFKTQRIEENSIQSNASTTISKNIIINNNSINNNHQVGMQIKQESQLSNFDKFFLHFKRRCYAFFKVNATISDDKKDFTFQYEKKNKDSVFYKIKYNHETRKIIRYEKSENNNVILIIEDENESEALLEELKSMLEDISTNVEKKIIL